MARLAERIAVIGGGFVGKAIARGFLEHVGEVRVHDVVPERSTHTLAEALDCDFTFVCVPTPALPDGTCDTDYVSTVIQDAFEVRRESRLVIKSTVPVGYTQRAAAIYGSPMAILHSPEFLTQRCAQVDFQTPARNIVGIPNWGSLKYGGATRESYEAGKALAELYQKRFPGVPCLTMSSDESELVKLAQNSFFMAKVAFFNLVYQIAQATGADFERVRAGMLSDGRIAHAHTSVPGPDSLLGAGGKCLVKDCADLYTTALAAGLPPERGPAVLAEILRFNSEIRGKIDPEMTQVTV
jgi:UDPglucose 6-dehydrogenase